MEILPGCFFPTEVVFLDNSEIYLQTFELFFERHLKHIKLKTFSKPQDALDYIASKAKPNFEQFFQPEDTFCSNCYAMKLNMFSLHKMIYDRSRFSQISTIIADYNLGADQMNGVEFCQKVDGENIQRILFTEERGRNFVIQAFNENYIQKYISKEKVHDLKVIQELVHQSQERYFFENTKSIQIALKQNPDFPLAIYSEAFQSYFRSFLETNNISEYYLLDAVGSYLMIDKENRIKILFVQNEDQCRANYLEQKEEVDSELREKLEVGEVVYCNTSFWTQENKKTNSLFVPAECIQDPQSGAKFYCACLQNVDFIDASKIALEDNIA